LSGDGAVPRLLAAAEFIEADLWQQCVRLGAVTLLAYQQALRNLNSDDRQ
jgi:hypothetical protein